MGCELSPAKSGRKTKGVAIYLDEKANYHPDTEDAGGASRSGQASIIMCKHRTIEVKLRRTIRRLRWSCSQLGLEGLAAHVTADAVGFLWLKKTH